MTNKTWQAVGQWIVIVAVWMGATALPVHAETRIAVGDPVSFDFTTVDGQSLNTDALEGYLLVVHFWAAVSEPSVNLMPALQQEVFEPYRQRGVALLSVSVDPDPALARQAIEDLGMNWINAINAEQDRPINAQFFTGRYGVPHTFLISPTGELLWEGHPNYLAEPLRDAMMRTPPDAWHQDVAAALGLGEPAIDANQIARLASEAMYRQPPDFGELFRQVEQLPPSAFDEAKVKSLGRSIQRTLTRLPDEYRATYENYRTSLPEIAASLDAWMDASARSISDTSDTTVVVNPALVASRFKQAEDAEAAGDDLAAYDLYRWIVSRAPNSDEALLAQDVVMILEADPEFMARVEAQATEDKAQNLMTMARNFAAANLTAKANETYQQVIDQYPDTEAAKEAATALAE